MTEAWEAMICPGDAEIALKLLGEVQRTQDAKTLEAVGAKIVTKESFFAEPAEEQD